MVREAGNEENANDAGGDIAVVAEEIGLPIAADPNNGEAVEEDQEQNPAQQQQLNTTEFYAVFTPQRYPLGNFSMFIETHNNEEFRYIKRFDPQSNTNCNVPVVFQNGIWITVEQPAAAVLQSQPLQELNNPGPLSQGFNDYGPPPSSQGFGNPGPPYQEFDFQGLPPQGFNPHLSLPQGYNNPELFYHPSPGFNHMPPIPGYNQGIPSQGFNHHGPPSQRYNIPGLPPPGYNSGPLPRVFNNHELPSQGYIDPNMYQQGFYDHGLPTQGYYQECGYINQRLPHYENNILQQQPQKCFPPLGELAQEVQRVVDNVVSVPDRKWLKLPKSLEPSLFLKKLKGSKLCISRINWLKARDGGLLSYLTEQLKTIRMLNSTLCEPKKLPPLTSVKTYRKYWINKYSGRKEDFSSPILRLMHEEVAKAVKDAAQEKDTNPRPSERLAESFGLLRKTYIVLLKKRYIQTPSTEYRINETVDKLLIELIFKRKDRFTIDDENLNQGL